MSGLVYRNSRLENEGAVEVVDDAMGDGDVQYVNVRPRHDGLGDVLSSSERFDSWSLHGQAGGIEQTFPTSFESATGCFCAAQLSRFFFLAWHLDRKLS
jgi:hypothetical protein